LKGIIKMWTKSQLA